MKRRKFQQQKKKQNGIRSYHIQVEKLIRSTLTSNRCQNEKCLTFQSNWITIWALLFLAIVLIFICALRTSRNDDVMAWWNCIQNERKRLFYQLKNNFKIEISKWTRKCQNQNVRKNAFVHTKNYFLMMKHEFWWVRERESYDGAT